MLYILTAYRFANKERHSYVVGAYDNYMDAHKAGYEETEHRGGKYICEVIGVELNKNCKKPLFKEWLN